MSAKSPRLVFLNQNRFRSRNYIGIGSFALMAFSLVGFAYWFLGNVKLWGTDCTGSQEVHLDLHLDAIPIGKCGCSTLAGACEAYSFCSNNKCLANCVSSLQGRSTNAKCLCVSDVECSAHQVCKAGECRRQPTSNRHDKMLMHWQETLALEEQQEAHYPKNDDASPRLAIVMGFPSFQVDHVLFSLRMWASMSRCGTTNPNVGLVLYASDVHAHEEGLSRIKPFTDSSASLQACFSDIQFLHTAFSEKDNSYVNRGKFWTYALNESSLWGKPAQLHSYPWWTKPVQGFTHMYWMEPDVFPVRKDWVGLLYAQTQRAFLAGTWVLGAVQGNSLKMFESADYFHINGNAVYDMRSKAFRELVRGLLS